MKGRGTYNRIVLPVAMLLIVVLGILGLRGLTLQSLALEQYARCGIEPHVHTTQCYEGAQRTCYQTTHTHNRNCYLVLLKDNDINDLLSMMDEQQDNSLESLLSQTVTNALVYNTDLISPLVTTPTVADVSALNTTIVENNVTPAMVLNEDLYTEGGTSDQLGAALPGGTGGVSTLALGDTPSTGSQQANYYVYLDGRWQVVGTLSFSTGRSNSRYYARETTSEILRLYNNALGIPLTTSNLNLRYATSANAATWTAATRSGNYTMFGSNYSSQSSARAAKYVRLMDTSGGPLAFYTVTLEYADGTKETEIVRSGDSITLPEGYTWRVDENTYEGGTSVEITSTTTFVEGDPDPRLKIFYRVNFPTVSDVTVDTVPTLANAAVSTITDYVEEQADSRIRNVSQQEVKGAVNNNSTGLSRVIRFMGWQIQGSDTILSPNSTLTWAELQTYVGSGKTLTLEGVWEYDPLQTASFFVRYDSVAVDTDGNVTGQDSNLYTPELFAAFVGGVDTSLGTGALDALYHIADTTADNSYGADQEIRALYGQKSEGVWLTTFPTDDEIFSLLKNYASHLSVEGEAVDVDDLNDNVYTIRWYVFKSQSDAWHIDGRLVKKEGLLDVTKSFAGNAEAIAQAKEDFYIRLAHQSKNEVYYLYLQQPAAAPADGTVVLPDAARSGENFYTWRISGMKYGDPWQATEHTGKTIGVVVHSDYRIVDTYGDQSRVGTGATVDFYGSTIATDMDVWYPLTINYTNIYHNTDSIIIKKEDATTGAPLGGAVFRLLQNGEVMKFTYNAAENAYYYDAVNGTVTELAGSVTGYYELNVHNFSYEEGNIEVQELQAPYGYTPIENIVLGYSSSLLVASASEEPAAAESPPAEERPPAEENPAEETVVGDETMAAVMLASSTEEEVTILTPSPMASYSNGLLIIKNSTESTSVTVRKQWLCPAEDWQSVTMQLMANGAPVTSLISGVELTRELNGDNGWTTTWNDLPLYANGAEIVWSVREVKIGSEKCLSDYSFVNWLVDYSPPTYTYNREGVLSNTAFTVTNDTYRTLLRLVKTNLGGGIRLEGATFTLEHLIDGEVDPAFVVRTMTTGTDGTITFDNLFYGDYRLVETHPPDGYLPMETPIYLTIHTDGTVTVQEHPYAQSGSSAYTMQVLNEPQRPLPETGGSGRGGYILSGLACIAAALGYILSPRRREGGDRPD